MKRTALLQRILKGLRIILIGSTSLTLACVPDSGSGDDALLTLLQSPSTGVGSVIAEEGQFYADTVTEATNISASMFGDPAAAANGIGGTYSMRYERTGGPFSYCKDHDKVPAFSQLPSPSGSFENERFRLYSVGNGMVEGYGRVSSGL